MIATGLIYIGIGVLAYLTYFLLSSVFAKRTLVSEVKTEAGDIPGLLFLGLITFAWPLILMVLLICDLTGRNLGIGDDL